MVRGLLHSPRESDSPFDDVLRAGEQQGVFKTGVDTREFYISLAGIYSVRINNAATLSYALGVDLLTQAGRVASQERAMSLLIDGIRA